MRERVFDRQTGPDSEPKLCMSRSQGGLDVGGLLHSRKQKPQIAGAFRPCRNVIVQAGGDLQIGDARNFPCRVLPFYFFKNPTAGHRNHHHAGSCGFAKRVWAWQVERMPEQQFLQADLFTSLLQFKSQCFGTKPANGTRGNFDGPNVLFVQSEFRMNRTMRESHGPSRR